MIAAFKPENVYDVLAIPASWDCFKFGGWLYRRRPDDRTLFYRERWLGLTPEGKPE